MKKQKKNKVKTVVYLIHFILIDIWARNGVLHIFWGGRRVVSIFCCASLVSGNRNKSKGGGGHYCTPS